MFVSYHLLLIIANKLNEKHSFAINNIYLKIETSRTYLNILYLYQAPVSHCNVTIETCNPSILYEDISFIVPLSSLDSWLVSKISMEIRKPTVLRKT